MGAGHEVLVIGGGVAGLSAAIVLAEAGHDVRVAARELGEGTTSAVAAAFWYPYHAYPEDQVTRLASASLRRFQTLMDDPSTGVLRRDALEVYPGPVAAPGWSTAAERFESAAPELLPPGYGFGHAFTTAVVETPIYLEWLRARVHALGGRIERRAITTLDEALRECPRVINCAGLGARELAGDRLLHPVRGQVVRVENPGLTRVWIDEHSGPAITYIVPRSRDVVLGGTWQEGDWSTTPDPATRDAILDRCRALVPELAGAPVVGERVGLRPVRRGGPRVEAEKWPGGTVVHAYGHGGAGVTLAWGCADEVAALAL